jgi:rare lipoprotein A
VCSMTVFKSSNEVRSRTRCPLARGMSASPRRLTLQRSESTRWWHGCRVWLVAACMFASACTISQRQSDGDKHGFSPSAVALHVERRGDNIRVTWERHTPRIARATDGVLFIEDGDLPQREVRLSAEDLHSGSVLYVPSSERVRFRLSIGSAGSNVALNPRQDMDTASTRTRAADSASTRQSLSDTSLRPQAAHAAQPLSSGDRLQETPAGALFMQRFDAGRHAGEAIAQTGFASFYAAESDEMTAAHPTLPIGSRVRVTNLRNGRSVVVVVRRGGSRNSVRIVNVSFRAAQELGFVRAGTTHVSLEPSE